MELRELKKGDKFKYAGEGTIDDTVYTFHHLDGMYSYITYEHEGKTHLTHFKHDTPIKKLPL